MTFLSFFFQFCFSIQTNIKGGFQKIFMGSPIARRLNPSAPINKKGVQSIILPMRKEFYTNLSLKEGQTVQTVIDGKEATVTKRKGRLWRLINRF